MRKLALLILAATAVTGQAEDRAFRCQDKNGGVVYQWDPCPGMGDAQEWVEMKKMRDDTRREYEAAIVKKRRDDYEKERLESERERDEVVRAQQRHFAGEMAREARANRHYDQRQNYLRRAQEYRDQAAVSRARGWNSSEIYERARADEYERQAREFE